MATKRKPAKKKAARKPKRVTVTLTFTASDFAGLTRVARELGVSLETFVTDAIERRLSAGD